MTIKNAYEKIDTIANEPGKIGKEDLVRAGLANDTFRKVLVYALSPDRTYGVSKTVLKKVNDTAKQEVSKYETGKKSPISMSDDEIWSVLDQLADRKLTGNAAIISIAVTMANVSDEACILLQRILLKDLRAGFGASTVNKAEPGAIITFDCMLAHKYEDKRIKDFPQFVEPKLDGVRTIAFVDSEKAKFFSRSGKEFLNYEHIGKALVAAFNAFHSSRSDNDTTIVPIAIDGEAIDSNFNNTVSTARKKGAQAEGAIFNAFDIVPQLIFKENDKKGDSQHGDYLERRALLSAFVEAAPSDSVKLINSYMVKSCEEIHHFYDIFQANGLEGVIVKHPKGLYHRRRNHGWMKIKADDSMDLKVIGYFEGEGKLEGSLGGLITDFDGVEVRVGGGFSDALRQELWGRLIKNKEDSAMGRLIEVGYHEITPDKSLRHPKFIKFRDSLTGAFE